jgi:hypothetical protein
VLYVAYVIFSGGIRMALEDPEMSKQGTAGKGENITVMISQKLEKIRSV